jgi:hypothetical protein
MKLIRFALFSVVLLHHAAGCTQAAQTGDFLNASYPLPICTEEFGTPDTVTLQNGRFENAEASVSVDKDNILTADLTGDGADETIVPVYCGWNGANFVVPTLMIYTTGKDGGNGSPVLLARLDESDFGRDYGRYYPDDSLWSEVGRLTVAGNSLYVEKFSGGAHCCPEFSIMLQYRWDGTNLVSAGQPEQQLLENSGQSQ